MDIRRNCGSPAMGVQNKSERKRNQKPSVKQIRRSAQARLIVYMLCAIVGFILGMFLLFQRSISAVVSFIGFEGICIVFQRLRKEKFLRKIVFVLIVSIVGGCLVKHLHWDVNLKRAAIALIAPFDDEENKAVRYNPSQTLTPATMTPNKEKWLKTNDNNHLEALNKMVVTQADFYKASYLIVSEEDRDFIFFQGGQYQVEEWPSKDLDEMANDKIRENIYLEVKQLVQDMRSKKRENTFDQKATQPEMDEISNISKREEEMSKKESICLEEIEENMDTRINYYVDKPKAELAKLIANQYQFFGMIAAYYNYSSNATIYYYSKSIEYELEYLSFSQVADDIAKKKIYWIAARYEDIALTCSGTEEAKWASELAIAFRRVGDEY